MKSKIKIILTCLFIVYVYNIFTTHLCKPVFDLSKILIKNNCIKHALFSPRDNIRQYIIELIKNEQKEIKIAIYSFSDKYIMQELIKAKKRNVKIDIILDSSNLYDRPEKIFALYNNGINLSVFNTSALMKKKSKSKKSLLPLMHHKFIIFEKNINNKSILLTGSFNLTYSANVLNCENIVILDDVLLLELYNSEFNNIKKNSSPLENYKICPKKKIKLFKQDMDKVRDFTISKL